MAAPSSLAGASTTITVDGIDLHVYGLTVLSVSNPLPQAVESMAQIKGKDGAFDFTKNYSYRNMTISGDITADSHSQLVSYIDSINTLFRLRENGSTFKLIFSDQPDRAWLCRYSSFDVQTKSLKNYGKTASYVLTLTCAKPFAEAIEPTFGFARLSMNKPLSINYSGTVKTPLNLVVRNGHVNVALPNKMDVGGNPISTSLRWVTTNCDLVSSERIRNSYSEYVIELSRIADPLQNYLATIEDLLPLLNITKSYVFGVRVMSKGDITFRIVLTGGTDKEVVIPSSFVYYKDGFIVITPEDLEDVTAVSFEIEISGDSPDADLAIIDGVYLYELMDIFDTDMLTENFVPPPYITGSEVVLTDLELILSKTKNIFLWAPEDGVSVNNFITGITSASTIKDPIGDEAVLYFDKEGICYSDYMQVLPAKSYVVSYEYLMLMSEDLAGDPDTTVDINFHKEGYYTTYSFRPVINSVWTKESAAISPGQGSYLISISIKNADRNIKLYIKNIMVRESTESSSYEKPVFLKQSIFGDISKNNEISIDNERLVFRFNDAENKAVTNAANVVSGDRLELSPGSNTLMFRDARHNITTHSGIAESSTGTACVIYSYRKRFL